jgi:uncharacterized membrane protein YcjF (UPF0283 family)
MVLTLICMLAGAGMSGLLAEPDPMGNVIAAAAVAVAASVTVTAFSRCRWVSFVFMACCLVLVSMGVVPAVLVDARILRRLTWCILGAESASRIRLAA